MNQNRKKKTEGKAQTVMEQVVERRTIGPSIHFKNGFDRIGGGVGYPQCSKPPPKPKPAATPGTNKRSNKKGKGLPKITK